MIEEITKKSDSNNTSRQKIAFALQLNVSVTHSLGFNPSVVITDNNGYVFVGEIQHFNLNQLVVNFKKPKSGFILIN